MADIQAPSLPFEGYKWRWACKTPTEALNDPAILLGVLRIMNELDGSGLKYRSEAFAERLRKLDADIVSTVKLAQRVGDRNLIRNSAQYWKLLGLIPRQRTGGVITVTPLGKGVAIGEVEQGDLVALTIAGLVLPNPVAYSSGEIATWERAGLQVRPLRLVLDVMRRLQSRGMGWITPDEVARIVVPLAGARQSAADIAGQVELFRADPESFGDWPDCTPRENDRRYVREFLLFLYYYGFVGKAAAGEEPANRFLERYEYLPELDDTIFELVEGDVASSLSLGAARTLERIQAADISSTVTSAVSSRRSKRPGQGAFRQQLLDEIGHCPITNVDFPDVLEAAHIKPCAYGGKTTIDNGWPMRVDIHRLFDSGQLRIRPDEPYGVIEFTNSRARENYRELDGHAIRIPDATNWENVRWRYDNYMIGMRVDG